MLLPDASGLQVIAICAGGAFLLAWLVGTIQDIFEFSPENRDRIQNYLVELQLMDPKGEEASLHIVRSFRCWARLIRRYEWRFRSDDGLKNVQVSPGQVIDETKHLGQHRILHDFGTSAPRWRLFNIEFSGTFGHAFMNTQGEFWETAISMPTKEFQIQIRFHPDHAPNLDSFTVREIVGFSEFDVLRARLQFSEIEGAVIAILSVKRPKHFATYRLAWEWNEEAG